MPWPNVARCTIPIQQGTYGWTESYFLDNPSSTLAPEMLLLQGLAQKRIVMCGAQAYISFLKVSNEATARDVLVNGLGPQGTTPYVGTGSQPSDFQDTALLVKRVTPNNVNIAPLYMRGLWDSWCVGGNFNLVDPMFVGLFNSWSTYLIANAFGFLGKSVATPARQMIGSVTSNVNGQVVITTGANVFTAPQVGTKVKVFISGVQGAAIINGSQIVVVTAMNSCTTVKRIPIFPYLGGGFLSNSIPFLYLIGANYAVRTVERKAGRPLYQSRGRARVRRLS